MRDRRFAVNALMDKAEITHWVNGGQSG